MPSFYEKIAEVQHDMGIVVPHNKRGHHGTYADLQAVLEVVRPALREHRLVLFEQIINDKEGSHLRLTLLDLDDDEAFVDSTYPLPVTENSQAFGSAITYGRRYMMVTMLGLFAAEDDDGTAASQKPARKKPRDPKKDQRDAFIVEVGKKLIKVGKMNDSAANDHAEAMLTEWGNARDRQVLPLIGDEVTDAWRDIVTAIDEGRWKTEDFKEYLETSAPF